MNKFLYILPTILAWSLPNFLLKELRNTFSSPEIIILYHFVWHLFLFSFSIYILLFKTKIANNFIKKSIYLPNNMKLILLSMVLLGITAQYFYIKLLKTVDISEIIPIIRGGSSLVIIFVGYYFFKEKLTVKRIIGIFIVLLGIYLINSAD